MLALSSGAIVACFTLGSILRTTSPRGWIPRENRGFSLPAFLVPLLISDDGDVLFYLFLTTSGCPLCPAITYTSSHSTPAKQTVGLFAAMPDRNSCCPQRIVWIEASSGAIWRLRDSTDQVQAQYPRPQRLMMSCIVSLRSEALKACLVLVALTQRLSFIESALNDLIGLATGVTSSGHRSWRTSKHLASSINIWRFTNKALVMAGRRFQV